MMMELKLSKQRKAGKEKERKKKKERKEEVKLKHLAVPPRGTLDNAGP